VDDDGHTRTADWVERLRALRRLLGWSQRRLAKELRVTPAAVSQWESGQRAIRGPVRRLLEIYEETLGMIDPPAAHGGRKINGSWVHRTLRLSAATARTATRLAGSSLTSLIATDVRAAEIKRATQIAIADDVADSFGEMKGLAMKLGQTVSYPSFAAPERVRDRLRSLQDEAPAMDGAAIDAVFRDSLGKTPDRIFEAWERRPFAAASIGQVHRATLPGGARVAVKVQYPGIREAIESDLSSAAALELVTGLGFGLRAPRPGDLLEELGEHVLRECDYEEEARNQEEFRRICADYADVVVPRVHRRFSGSRVLTMDYVEGRRFATFVREASQAEKDRAGAILFRVAMSSIYEHRIFNADPHPGNYLFTDAGQVALLDFGCVKRFPRVFVERLAQYYHALSEGRRDDADRLVLQMGVAVEREGFDFDYHHHVMRQLFEPWMSERPFRFNAHYVERNWRGLVLDNPNRAVMRLPRDVLFLTRLEWGLHSVLADLGAQADWKALFVPSIRASS
jgi:predicted unusual protein kinase regulating ubiquinone biosynthesis (AarF/ABC1/UbiB family)/DNA-binding XRE family transcriptional regulator